MVKSLFALWVIKGYKENEGILQPFVDQKLTKLKFEISNKPDLAFLIKRRKKNWLTFL